MFFILLMLVFICFLDLDWSVCAENFCLLLRRSVQSFNFPPWTAPRTFKPLKIGLFKAAFKCLAQAQFFIARFFVWSTNVVEFRKVTYYFVVPLLGFFVCKHHSTIWKFLLSHLLTKADSLPWNSTIIKTKTRIFGWFKFATSPKWGSNSPPLVVQMPVGLPGGRTVEASNWSTLKSVLLTRQRSYKRKFSTSCWSPIWHQIHFTRLHQVSEAIRVSIFISHKWFRPFLLVTHFSLRRHATDSN